jgi:glycosyltransferase involved in cell wall biosynthesis
MSLAATERQPAMAPIERHARDQAAGRLRICFISETIHAGVGRHIADAIRALSDRGHCVHLLYSPIRLDPALLAAIQEKSTARCVAIAMPRAIGPGDGPAFRQILRYIRTEGPFDIIHGHSSKGGGYARLLRFFLATPIIYTPHAFITLSPVTRPAKRLAYGAIEAVLARLTTRVICLSVDELEHARRLSIPPARLVTIAHGVSDVSTLPRDEIRRRLGLAQDQVVVGFVGRMDDQKAPERMVAAARRLLPEMPRLVFLMIGDGPKRARLEAELDAAGLGDRARWLGAADARQFMPAMDILAVSSLYEGFAYVMIEALHAGLPIISTPVGGARETIEPGVNGLIVPGDEQDQFAAAIRRLASDDGLRAGMAHASRARAPLFTIPAMADATENLYRAVLRRRKIR